MEIDFKKFTELYLLHDLRHAYACLTNSDLPDDEAEHDRFIFRYLEWLAQNQVRLPKKRRLSLRVCGIVDVPDYGFPVTRLKTKGLKSLTTVLDYKALAAYCHGVYVDGDKLVATNSRLLVIIDNSEQLEDGHIIDPKTGELLRAKYPVYKSVIPNHDQSVTFDIPLLLKAAKKVVEFSKNTDNKCIVAIDFGICRTAIDAGLLLTAMSVLDANGSKTVKLGFDKEEPSKPITFHADNGNFALIMPIYLDWEDIPNSILGTIVGKKTDEQAKDILKPGPAMVTVQEPAPKSKAQKPEVMPVFELPLAVSFIKSYCGWNGKVKSKTQVYAFIKKLQKAITERKIRKTSEYAPQIEYIQARLIAFYKGMKSSTKTYEIPAAKLAELKAKSNQQWADYVVITKKYINILNSTKTGLKEKAQNLLKQIDKGVFMGSRKEAIATIRKSLGEYLSGKTKEPVINEMALQGLYGLAGLSGLGNLPAPGGSAPADAAVVSASDFKHASFNLMGFTGKWLRLIGNPAVPFKIMLWGTGGSGKSTLALELARYLAGALNKRVLYIANEEGASATLHEKMTRLGAFHPNLFITRVLPPSLVEYDFVFCDSVNSMQMELGAFDRMEKLYPRLSWVLLFQTTKDGKFLGEKNWQHAVDVEVFCENGKARALKSRFGGKESVDVF